MAELRVTTTTTYKLENGKWVQESINVSEKMKSISHKASNILGPDGRLNTEVMNKLFEGTLGGVRDSIRNSAN